VTNSKFYNKVNIFLVDVNTTYDNIAPPNNYKEKNSTPSNVVDKTTAKCTHYQRSKPGAVRQRSVHNRMSNDWWKNISQTLNNIWSNTW